MDIKADSSVAELMREAKGRIDGQAMYLALAILLVGTVAFSARNALNGDFSFQAWRIVLVSGLMLPTEILVYFFLAAMGMGGVKFSRPANAVCLLLIPIYLFVKLS